MYLKCCIPGCLSRRRDTFLHKFPNCEKRLRKWLYHINSDFVRNKNFSELRSLQICHRHFEDRFVTGKSRIMSSAYPTLFLQSEILNGIPANSLETSESVPHFDVFTPKEHRHIDHSYYKLLDPTEELPSTSVAEKLISPIADVRNQRLLNPIEEESSTSSAMEQFQISSAYAVEEPSTELETDVDTAETFVDFEEHVLQVHPDPIEENPPIDENPTTESATSVNTAENRIFYVKPVLQPGLPSEEKSPTNENPSTESATSVNTAQHRILYVKHVSQPCATPTVLYKATGTANIKNINPTAKAKSRQQRTKGKSVATGTKHRSSAQDSQNEDISAGELNDI